MLSMFSRRSETTGFAALNLPAVLLNALKEIGFTEPTPIQAQAIPVILEGHDLIGNAQTGTGKTGAFVLPILARLLADPDAKLSAQGPEVLILSPTRELANQINETVKALRRGTDIRSIVIFGGVGQSQQVSDLRRHHPRVLVATPGRLLDLVNQRLLNLSSISTLVLDEADRMLDMGFIHDIRRVVALIPKKRQTLMFSATMPKDIVQLAQKILHLPKRVAVDPVSSAVEAIDQSVIHVDREQKRLALLALLRNEEFTRSIVFTRTKHVADRIATFLTRNAVVSGAIHANKSQGARLRALEGFRDGKIAVLVATDIAARGIDVDDVSHVINYDLPEVPETYVHRIGRTGRARKQGAAISLCDHEQRDLLRAIEKHLGQTVRVDPKPNMDFVLAVAPAVAPRRDFRRGRR